jgi:hypothetical protein
MSEQIIGTNTPNMLVVNTDTTKIFLWNNRYENGVVENDEVYDDLVLAAGTVMGRIAATNKLVVIDKAASDGSQFPVGVLNQDWTIEAGDEQTVSICVAGDVNQNALVLPSGTALTDVISGKTLFDRIGSDTVGIKLVPSTELTGFDND